MASLLRIKGFVYTPRTDSENGRIKAYQLFFSQDGKEWGEPIEGTFNNSSAAQTVGLKAPVEARYFKLVALSEAHGRPWASAAELSVVR
jgi:beta-galactosidase